MGFQINYYNFMRVHPQAYPKYARKAALLL
jgi:hypothetical protein